MTPTRAAPVLVLVGAVVVLVLLLRSYARSVAFPGSPFRIPEDIERRVPGARLVPVRTADHLELTGVWVEARTVGPAILYFHGNAESAALNVPLAAEMAARGVSVFLAEYRGFGGQPGRPTEAGLRKDAEAAWLALLELGVPASRVVVVGRSLGTGVAAPLAADHSPALLLLVSPFTSAVDMGRLLVGPLAPLLVPDRFDVGAALLRVRAPVVILHGTEDEVVPFSMGQRLAASRAGIRLVPLPGRGHNDIPELGSLLLVEIMRHASGGPG